MNYEQVKKFVSGLNKGDVIAPEKCEIILGMSCNDENYQLGMMKLSNDLIRASVEINRPLSVRVHHNSIVVNTDHEASEYHEQQQIYGIRKFKRHHKLHDKLVDQNNLSREQLESHKLSSELSRRIKNAIDSEIRIIRVKSKRVK